MTNKKSILIMFLFFLSFFAFSNNVFAEDDTFKCSYTSILKQNDRVEFAIMRDLSTEPPKIIYISDNLGNNYTFYSYISENDNRKQYNDGASCPKYLVQFKPDSGMSVDPTHFYVFKSEPSTDIISKSNRAFKIDDLPNGGVSGTSGDDKTHNCIYNKYIYSKNTNSWVIQNDMNSTMIYTTDTSNFKNQLSNIRFQFPNDNRTYYYGGKSLIKASDLRIGSCPEYLVYTSGGLFGTTDFVDGYGSDKTIDDMKEIAKSANDVFYVKTDAQKEIDKKITAQNTCSYYRGTSRMDIEFVKGYDIANASNVIYYDVNITYYGADSTSIGKKFVGDIRNFISDMYDKIIDNSDCSAYPYLYVDEKNDENSIIGFSFYKQITDVKQRFKYYKIATTADEAKNYIEELNYARDLINELVNAMQRNININAREKEIKNIFYYAASQNEGKTAPDDVQNVWTYLSANGKVNKAVYDYTSYWYAQANNYYNMYVADATFDAALKTAAQQVMDVISQNVKTGVIPIPDGCDMLSPNLINFLAWGLRIIRYGAVAIAIILGMTDFFRAIAESDDKAFQKAGGRFLKRIIAVALIFLSVLFIQFILYNYALPGIGEDEINLCNIVNS